MAGRGVPPGGHGRGRGLPGQPGGMGRGVVSFPSIGRSTPIPIPGQLSLHEQQMASLVLSSSPPGEVGRSGLSSPEDRVSVQSEATSTRRPGFALDDGVVRGRGMGRGMNIPLRFTLSEFGQDEENAGVTPPKSPDKLTASPDVSPQLSPPHTPLQSPEHSAEVSPNEEPSPESSPPMQPTSSGSKGELNPKATAPTAPPKPEPPKSLMIRKGDKGTIAEYGTNFIRLSVEMGKGMFEYHVGFDPPIESTQFRKRALRFHTNYLGTVRMFDGTTLYLPQELDQKTITLTGEHPADPSVRVKTILRFVKEKEVNECVQFYNILFNRVMEVLSMVQLKRSFYDIRTVHHITQHKLEIWPGFVHSVDKQEGGLMLNLDISHKVLRKETVFDILQLVRNAGQANWKKAFEEQIVGQVVLTRYNNMSYRIDDILWDLSPTSTFPKKGEEVRFIDYYKSQHNIPIHEMDQPLLLSKIKPRKNDLNNEIKTVCLIPELCSMTGLTSEHTSNFQIMKDIAQFTRITPQQRVVSAKAFLKRVEDDPDCKKVLSDWGLQLESNPLHVQGRIASGPSLTFSNRLTVREANADFSKESGANCFDPKHLKEWVVLVSQRDAELAKRLMDTYKQVCQSLGIRFSPGKIITMQKTNAADYVRQLREVSKNRGEFQFVVAIFPTQRDDLYAAFKKSCLAELPIPSQVILSKTLRNDKRVRSIMVKVALQINCKLGGAIWSLNIPIKDTLMVVGIDVHHDPTKRNPSITALVASLDNGCTQYYSRVVVQKPHQEMVDALRTTFEDALKEYSALNGSPPTRIVVFRDGVSNSQLDTTAKHEVQQFLEAINAKAKDLQLFTFVVVQKRLSERFYLVKNGRFDNPPPGSIIDHTVTRPYVYDFFLISQMVRQGTVTPTHYIVLHDMGEIKPDLIQKLSYATSFMYFNWPGTIRVPAVCQYAHKLAFLIGQHVKTEPSREMQRLLYYL